MIFVCMFFICSFMFSAVYSADASSALAPENVTVTLVQNVADDSMTLLYGNKIIPSEEIHSGILDYGGFTVRYLHWPVLYEKDVPTLYKLVICINDNYFSRELSPPNDKGVNDPIEAVKRFVTEQSVWKACVISTVIEGIPSEEIHSGILTYKGSTVRYLHFPVSYEKGVPTLYKLVICINESYFSRELWSPRDKEADDPIVAIKRFLSERFTWKLCAVSSAT